MIDAIYPNGLSIGEKDHVYEIGQVIAERVLEGARGTILVRIGLPSPDPQPGGDWYCPVQVVGIGEDAVTPAFGVDPVQALLHALQMAGIRLESVRRSDSSLSWLGDPDLGFPQTGMG